MYTTSCIDCSVCKIVRSFYTERTLQTDTGAQNAHIPAVIKGICVPTSASLVRMSYQSAKCPLNTLHAWPHLAHFAHCLDWSLTLSAKFVMGSNVV